MADRWPLPKLTGTKMTMRTYAVDYFLGEPIGMPSEKKAVRSLYNPKTQQYEEISLAQFQHLLKQGKIEESVSQSPYDGQPQRTYRLL